MNRMPLEIQTLYAELVERLSAWEAHRSMGHLSGSFVSKAIKGENYWYFQYSEPGGRKRQIYIGRKDRFLDEVIKKYRDARQQTAGDRADIQRLCSLLRAGGAMAADAATTRVISALSDAAVFRLDGVLVGTHAFVAIGNLLGVRWAEATLGTQDIDIAAESTVSIVIPDGSADVPGVLESLEMGFLPVPQLDPRSPSTFFKVRGKGLRVDLLTPQRGRRVSGVVNVPRFNAAAQPLPFLDFLIARPARGAIVNGGGVLVNVPDPARFAFHKLIVSGERTVTMHAKREKDIRQAGQVLEVLVDDRPGDLRVAWDEIRGRGAGWVRRVRDGIAALETFRPDIAEGLRSVAS